MVFLHGSAKLWFFVSTSELTLSSAEFPLDDTAYLPQLVLPQGFLLGIH